MTDLEIRITHDIIKESVELMQNKRAEGFSAHTLKKWVSVESLLDCITHLQAKAFVSADPPTEFCHLIVDLIEKLEREKS